MKGQKRAGIDLSKLSWGTLRKYQYYFKIEGRDITTKKALIPLLEKHFAELKVDQTKVINTFLKIKRDDKNDQNYNLRKTRYAHSGVGFFDR